MGARKVGIMRIKDVPILERPYEKLELYGAEKLSNSELLAIIIKTGNKEESVVSLSQKVLTLIERHANLRALQDISIEEFMTIKGIGKVKAIQLKAVCELAKRMGQPLNSNKIIIKSPQDVANLLMEELRYQKTEEARVIILNTKNVVLKIVKISQGGTNFAMIEPKEVLVDAIKIGAPKIILLHNHPSGDSTPSESDFEVTDRIYESAEIMGIELLDHIVIGDGKFDSIFQNRNYKR
ncbi:MAG: DNA repair protein RadC [Clostridia bacterium]|nr:DNA repair protein RadC [Clostridia bacterium]